MVTRRRDRDDDLPPPGLARVGIRLLEWAEDIIYAGIVLFLLSAAGVLLALAARSTWQAIRDFDQPRLLELLDVLLLVFIIVELLYAVRSTIQNRRLVAEPFLLVGIIASIKEIVVLSAQAADVADQDVAFTNRLTQIAVLGVLVLLLGVTILLLRRKEREPLEGVKS